MAGQNGGPSLRTGMTYALERNGNSPLPMRTGANGGVRTTADPGVCCGSYNDAGDCSGACGGLEAACCEAAGAVNTTRWQFVGHGQGGYNVVPTYNYVGTGCGSYDKTTTTTYYGWRLRKCCFALPCVILAPLLVYMSMEVFGPEDHLLQSESSPHRLVIVTPAPMAAPSPSAALEKYNCAAPGQWSPGQVHWCCVHYGRRCIPGTTPPARPVPVPVPAPMPAALGASQPYDCNVDFLDCYHCLVARWSVSKRDYCCKHARRGCPTKAPPPPPPPLPHTATTSSPPYDCGVDFTACYHCLMTRWSVGKRSWCCTHARRGCPTMPPHEKATSVPFDCGAGFTHWKSGWSVQKKQWCCLHHHKGCPPTAPVPAAHAGGEKAA